MSRIRLLSEQVANQIAAGEVVDRPAAVVKELAENSLDAGATRIDIAIEGGGAGLIRVADDGCGMDRDDVLLCLERHATSKLREASELEAIKSLGFRGEAIPSIASVSWLTILSRQREAPLGARAEVRHGALKEVREEGCACGTVMEALDLSRQLTREDGGDLLTLALLSVPCGMGIAALSRFNFSQTLLTEQRKK